LRGIGELAGSQDATVAKITGTPPNWVDLSPDQTDEYGFQRAWVNLAKSQAEDTLWNTMDDAAIALAQKLAKSPQNIEYQYDGGWHPTPPPRGKVRDGLGTIGTGGLDGWQMAGSGSFMELGNNIIETIDGIGLLWYTRQQFGNFILWVDWRATYPDDNSGIFIRFPALGSSDPANDWKLAVDQGYEIQIDDTGKNPDVNPPMLGDPLHITGSVYKLAAATKVASRPLGQWNAYEIQAKGNDVTVTLNGQLASNLKNGNRPKQGYIGLQNHHVGSRVQFRNIRIQPL
jgi:hypothetical protein